MTDARQTQPPAPKGAPTPNGHVTPEREWTSDTVAEECATLEAACRDARERCDEPEIRRIEARLRLLRDETR